jgi:hypothetical protein
MSVLWVFSCFVSPFLIVHHDNNACLSCLVLCDVEQMSSSSSSSSFSSSNGWDFPSSFQIEGKTFSVGVDGMMDSSDFLTIKRKKDAYASFRQFKQLDEAKRAFAAVRKMGEIPYVGEVPYMSYPVPQSVRVHPYVAIALARWCSPELGDIMDGVLFRWLKTPSPSSSPASGSSASSSSSSSSSSAIENELSETKRKLVEVEEEKKDLEDWVNSLKKKNKRLKLANERHEADLENQKKAHRQELKEKLQSEIRYLTGVVLSVAINETADEYLAEMFKKDDDDNSASDSDSDSDNDSD